MTSLKRSGTFDLTRLRGGLAFCVWLGAGCALSLACSSESSDSPDSDEANDDSSRNSGGESGTTGGESGLGGDESTTGGTGNGAAPGSGGNTGVLDVVPSSGCELPATLTEGVHTFDLAGKSRQYTVRLPENYDPNVPWPLVLALHPNGSASGYWDGDAAPRNPREVLKDKAVLIVADAIGGNWRDYGTAEETWDARLEEELLYFDQLITDAKAGLCLDETAIFSLGFSGGGSFSGVLGCRRSDIRAIATSGMVIYFDPNDCVQAPAALMTLSEGDATDDRVEFVNYFRQSAECAETNQDIEPAGCVAYDGCAAGSPAIYCSYPGGHELPDYFMTEAWAFFDALR